jgi:hypothetical protein
MLSDEQIKQFQILYKRHFNEDITREEALKKGIRLINLVRIVSRPINNAENSHRDNYDKPTIMTF